MKSILHVLLMLLLVVGCPAVVDAHAMLNHSQPQQEAELTVPPKEIRVTFSENINTELSQLRLKDASGRTIEGTLRGEGANGLVLTVPSLPSGVYQVEWQVLSVDTHVTEGSFRFAVGVKLPKIRPAETLSLDGSEQPEPTEQPTASKPVKPTPAQQPAAANVSSPGAAPKEKTAPEPPRQKPSAVPSAPPNAQQKSGTPAGGDVQTTPAKPVAQTVSAPAATTAVSAGTTTEQVELVQPEAPAQVHQHSQGILHEHALHDGHQEWGRKLRIAEILTAGAAGVLVFLSVWKGFVRQLPQQRMSSRVQRGGYLICLGFFAILGVLELTLLADLLQRTDSWMSTVYTLLTSTVLGTVSWIRPLLALLLAVTTLLPQTRNGVASWMKLVLAAMLFATFPLTGHAMSDGEWSWLTVFAHTIHFGAAVVWIGGLSGLIWLSFTLPKEKESLYTLHELLQRFSRIALISVLIVIASGVLVSAFRLENGGQLGTTEYGAALLAKAAVFGFALMLAVVHRFHFLPQLASRVEGPVGGLTDWTALFWTLRAELLAGFIVLVLAGVLSTTAPPQMPTVLP